MKHELISVRDAMSEIVTHPRSSRIERILASQVLLSLSGKLLPGISEEWLDNKSLIELRRIQRDVVQRMLKTKAARKAQNRRAYLRKQIRKLEGADGTNN